MTLFYLPRSCRGRTLDLMPRLPHIVRTDLQVAHAYVHLSLPPRQPTPTEAEEALAIVEPASVDEQGRAEPWMPQPGESAQEYEAFRMWLDAGLDTPRGEVAKRWAWRERKNAFELFFGGTGLGSAAVRRDAALRVVTSGLHLLRIELAKLLAQSAGNAHPSMSAKEVAGALKSLVMVQRLLDGESTENVSVHVTDQYEGMTEDEFAVVAGIKMAALERAKGSTGTPQ